LTIQQLFPLPIDVFEEALLLHLLGIGFAGAQTFVSIFAHQL
jgi:hypothetical protein